MIAQSRLRSWMEPTATPMIAAGAASVSAADSPSRGETALAQIQDFDRVVEIYWPQVFRFVMASVRDRDAAQTLTQDCLWRAYQARARFRGDASLKTWLLRIAVNLVHDFNRNRRLQFWRQVRASRVDAAELSNWIPDLEISPEASAVIKERTKAVWEAAERLPQRQRTVFLLRFVEDLEILEIAAATGLKEGAVKVHLFRALRSIRKRVGSL